MSRRNVAPTNVRHDEYYVFLKNYGLGMCDILTSNIVLQGHSKRNTESQGFCIVYKCSSKVKNSERIFTFILTGAGNES